MPARPSSAAEPGLACGAAGGAIGTGWRFAMSAWRGPQRRLGGQDWRQSLADLGQGDQTGAYMIWTQIARSVRLAGGRWR